MDNVPSAGRVIEFCGGVAVVAFGLLELKAAREKVKAARKEDSTKPHAKEKD